MLKNNGAIREAVSPVLDAELSIREMKIILAEMYANSVSNPPDGEIGAFTARRQSPVFLALNELLDNLQEIH